ncbi:MAG TPA: arginine deiminase family protein [Thermomicrobiales bacterium]|nr:arginine deiminase family protein [Thermomicrobiales bacterium]
MQTMTPPVTGIGIGRYGGQSMIAPLKRVLVRKPTPPTSADQHAAFGYPRPVDHAVAEQQHARFVSLLRGAGAEVIEAGPDAPGLLDAIFAYDPSIITDAGAVLLRPGKALRQAEVDLHEQSYADLGIPILGRIEAPGTVEGGDTLWLDERTLAVGRGYRTNDDGIDQLRRILGPVGIDILRTELPHWRGPSECLHLMSFVSPIAADAAVVYLPLMATPFAQELSRRGIRFVEVPDEEFETQGCNVLALGPMKVLVLEGSPITRSRLEAAGCEVLVYEGSEISHNRAGGPTCLTRPILRES